MYGYLFAAIAFAGFSAAVLPIHQDAITNSYEIKQVRLEASQDEVEYIARALRRAIQDGHISLTTSGRRQITENELRTIVLPSIAPTREGNRELVADIKFFVDQTGDLFVQPESCELNSCMTRVRTMLMPKYIPADQRGLENDAEIDED